MPTRLVSVVVDTPDPKGLARWWGEALGWPVSDEDDESEASPPEGEPGVDLVFVPVADPSPGKNRVHLDLASESTEQAAAIVDRLRTAGATDLDVGQTTNQPWTVLADPAGNAFCVLEPQPEYRGSGALASIVVDCTDPARLAEFWAAASGWAVVRKTEPTVSLRAPDGRGPLLDLVRTGEPHSVKNRLHLDVAPFAEDDQAAEVARLEALGAVRTDVGQGEGEDITWVVLKDPEDNEFCVLSSRGEGP